MAVVEFGMVIEGFRLVVIREEVVTIDFLLDVVGICLDGEDVDGIGFDGITLEANLCLLEDVAINIVEDVIGVCLDGEDDEFCLGENTLEEDESLFDTFEEVEGGVTVDEDGIVLMDEVGLLLFGSGKGSETKRNKSVCNSKH